MNRRTLAAHLALAILFLTTRANAIRIIPLGDLPGGLSFSYPSAISADGSVVVGYSYSQMGQQEFVWKEGIGMRPLRELPQLPIPNQFYSATVFHLSADGNTAIGNRWFASNSHLQPDRIYRWTAQSVEVNLWRDATGDPKALSGDGKTIVGWRHRVPNTNDEQLAVIWRNGSLEDTPGMQSWDFVSFDGSVMVGQGNGTSKWWTAMTGYIDLGVAQVKDMSSDGRLLTGLVGNSLTPMYWTPTTNWQPLEVNGAPFRGFIMSADGSIMLDTNDSRTDDLLLKDGVVRNLSQILRSAATPEQPLNQLQLVDLSANGNFVTGIAFSPDQTYFSAYVFDISSIPEPPTISILLLTSTAGLLMSRKSALSVKNHSPTTSPPDLTLHSPPAK